MNTQTRDYLTFRRMITPVIIQVIFWIIVGLFVISQLIGILISLWLMFTEDFWAGLGGVLLSLLLLVIIPVIIRIYFELIILFFRMNETLTAIKNNTSATNGA